MRRVPTMALALPLGEQICDLQSNKNAQAPGLQAEWG
jgi:hypothetical protein